METPGISLYEIRICSIESYSLCSYSVELMVSITRSAQQTEGEGTYYLKKQCVTSSTYIISAILILKLGLLFNGTNELCTSCAINTAFSILINKHISLFFCVLYTC